MTVVSIPRLRDVRPGDVILTGAKAQGFVSHAIKYGSTLRFQPNIAQAARAARLLLLAVALGLSLALQWRGLGVVGAVVAALLLGIVASWFIAELGYRQKKDAYWNRFSHSALITGIARDGTVMVTEAVKRGVLEQPFHYSDEDYVVIDTGLDDLSRLRAVEFATDVVTAREKYGFVAIFGLFLYCVTGTKLCMQWAGTSICSGFICNALGGLGPDGYRGKLRYTWDRPPFSMMPSNLAAHFKIR